jgi:hypothetical protein
MAGLSHYRAARLPGVRAAVLDYPYRGKLHPIELFFYVCTDFDVPFDKLAGNKFMKFIIHFFLLS